MTFDERSVTVDVCLRLVCPTVGVQGTAASCGDYLVVLERIRLPRLTLPFGPARQPLGLTELTILVVVEIPYLFGD